jgi:hypothetical protein
MTSILEFKTTQITAFKTSMEVIDSLVSDVNLEVSSSGIRIRETNRTNKLFVSVFFSECNFDSYTFNSNSVFNTGIDLNNLVQILKPNLAYDTLKFCIIDKKTAKITLESFTRKEVKNCKILLLEGLPNTSGNIEESVYSHSVVLNSEMLSKYCKDIGRISDRIRIKLNRRELVLCTEDNITEYSISGGRSSTNLTITTEEPSKKYTTVLIPIKYILLACKCCMISELVTLFLDDIKPATIRFNLGSLGVLNLILF